MNISSPLKPKTSQAPKTIVRKKTPLRARPQLPPVPLPRIILSQLEGLSARVLQICLTEGLLWVAAALCAIVLVQGSLDWLFDLPWNTRLVFALGDLCLLGWLSWRYIIKPWKKQLTPEEAALRAEMRWPVLRTSLISAVQLAKHPEGSTRMVELLVQQVAKRAAEMNFRLAVDAKHLKKLTLSTTVLLIVTAGLGAWLMPKSLILLERILLINVPLPTETIVIAVSHDFAIPAGENIELSAKAQGKVPPAGQVQVTYEGKGSQMVPVTLDAFQPGYFHNQAAERPAGADLTGFTSTDGRGDEYKVVILHGPVLEKVGFEQTYPAYTGLGKVQRTAGNLTLLAGSKLRVEGRADQNLTSAQIQLKGINQQIPMLIDGDKKSISGRDHDPRTGTRGLLHRDEEHGWHRFAEQHALPRRGGAGQGA